MDYVDEILGLSEKDKVNGQIYKMTSTKTNKCYVGQTRSHKKNNNKYRPFGYNGRFNDHISEAICNTKKNQCVYLNNAIRKYGKESFVIKLIETCELDIMDERETYYIKENNSLFPNGYNLTKGGQNFSDTKVENNKDLQEFKKRGRDFGYKHKKQTLEKMKNYYDNVDEEMIEKKKETMSNSISKHFSEKRAELLSKIDIEYDEDYAKYIRPRMKDDKIISYVIRIKRRKYCQIESKKYSPEERYDILHDALKEAYEIQQKNKQK